MDAKTRKEIAAMIAEGVAAAMTPAEVSRPQKPMRRNTASTSKAPKASAARKPRAKKSPEVWIVRKSWKDEQPSARMIGAALHYGMPLTAVRKAQTCKLALSTAIGKHRGLKVEVQA